MYLGKLASKILGHSLTRKKLRRRTPYTGKGFSPKQLRGGTFSPCAKFSTCRGYK